jgi:hypothetical protein
VNFEQFGERFSVKYQVTVYTGLKEVLLCLLGVYVGIH